MCVCVWWANKKRHVIDITGFQNIFLLLQDPSEEGLAAAAKRCKLGPESLKRPAYESAETRPKKRPREEDNNISVLLSSDDEDENLVSSQLYIAQLPGHNYCCHMQASAKWYCNHLDDFQP